MQDEHKDTINIAIKGKQTEKECSSTNGDNEDKNEGEIL